MPIRKAYVETTIIADVLLKPGSAKCAAARGALKNYDETLLPVYAIKELKAGIVKNYAYVHEKLLQTRSLARTLEVISSLAQFRRYATSSALEALQAAIRLPRKATPQKGHTSNNDDKDLADRYRLAIASLLVRSWRRRRQVTTRTVDELDCYTESAPILNEYGVFDLTPLNCDPDTECCLADALRAEPGALRKMEAAIPVSSTRQEDVKRRQVLHDLARSKHFELNRDRCRALGDAIFAFFAPRDCVVLTTNAKDHAPLAQAIGKSVESPKTAPRASSATTS